MLRAVKVLLVLAIGIWALVGAVGNLADWHGVVDKVRGTTTMLTVSGGEQDWRATSNPMVIYLGAAMIPAAKTLSGVLCLAGAWRMWRARVESSAAFETAKALGLAGCGVILLMLFAGWIVIADTWFQGWRSETLQNGALNTALRYAGFVGLIALFVAAREDAGDN